MSINKLLWLKSVRLTRIKSLEVGGAFDHDGLPSTGVETFEDVAQFEFVFAAKFHQNDAGVLQKFLINITNIVLKIMS